jgi:hypothetical protein
MPLDTPAFTLHEKGYMRRQARLYVCRYVHTYVHTYVCVRISALADPNVMNTFQIRAPALSAILSGDFPSKRFIM